MCNDFFPSLIRYVEYTDLLLYIYIYTCFIYICLQKCFFHTQPEMSSLLYSVSLFDMKSSMESHGVALFHYVFLWCGFVSLRLLMVWFCFTTSSYDIISKFILKFNFFFFLHPLQEYDTFCIYNKTGSDCLIATCPC